MLEIKNLRKSYDANVILDDISLSIENGEILSILGPSGCGKTTLLNSILGLTSINEGQIIYGGKDYTKYSMKKRGFNIVFQDYSLFAHINVEKNIRYGLKNFPGLSTEEEIQEMIELLDLKPHLQKRIDQLSGGQKQRVALARTLVMKPQILLLDEPLSALDGVIKENIKARIEQIAQQLNLTMIIVTHDPEEALTMSDKVLILNEGKIAQFGSPQDIIERPADQFVEKFILNQLIIKKEKILTLFG
ncbi:ABC transporter ATP-binding protein [Lactococcus lactis subsp. lactis]|uniref:ABC transporter ATP-binding protein n=1 Tax=Lactococcus lactis TaxID=1358 RepID=UPI00223C240D|nr:ABC transporter ATP-binding protein [Lactococcus lactis]MCT0017228.1 ABC transporter ATP-binding protein [Lactococcus lactis subsp. lactis]